jgi:cell division topological specificity factor
MSLFSYFLKPQPSSAAIAKERLQIVVAHERSRRNRPDYFADLQRDLLEVVRKYVQVDQDAITVSMEKNDRHEILELNIILPDDTGQKRTQRR